MVKEITLLRRINKYLKLEGFLYKNEITFLERRIDVIGLKEKKIFTFELKVKDWKKALEQAITCKICSHYVYVAFWYDYLPQNLKIFEEYGIGVMSINNSVNIIIEAKKSDIIHKSLLNKIRNQFT